MGEPKKKTSDVIMNYHKFKELTNKRISSEGRFGGGGKLESSGKTSAEQTLMLRIPGEKGPTRQRKWEEPCRQKE